jgi:hypothetical protein
MLEHDGAISDRGALISESAVENPLLSGTQSCRREDNALLRLGGVRSSVFYEPSLPPQQRIANARKNFVAAPVGAFRLQDRAPRCCAKLRLRNPGVLAGASRSEASDCNGAIDLSGGERNG